MCVCVCVCVCVFMLQRSHEIIQLCNPFLLAISEFSSYKHILHTKKRLSLENHYGGADKSLARPGRNKFMFLSEWREFPSAPCFAGKQT